MSRLVSLSGNARYRPDLIGLACGKVAAARAQLELSALDFADALGQVLNWQPSAHHVVQWEGGTAPPPGDVLAACELLLTCGIVGQDPGVGSSDFHPEDDSPLGDAASDAAAMEAFRKADLRVGGGRMYSTVAKYLMTKVGPRLLLATPEGDDRVIFTSAAAVSDMAGWMAHDAGDDQLASKHFTRARDLVAIGCDIQLTAHVNASIGHLAHHSEDPSSAIKSAEAGLAGLAKGPRCPELEARLYAISAKGYAALDEPAKCVRQLSLAEKALLSVPEQRRSQWVSGFDEASLASEAARCMLQLGQLKEAKRQAELIVALRPPSRPRSRSFGLVVQAHVLVALGKPDEAASVATQIIDTTASIGSGIVTQQLIELRRSLIPYRSNSSVNEFIQQANSSIRSRLWAHRGTETNYYAVGGLNVR